MTASTSLDFFFKSFSFVSYGALQPADGAWTWLASSPPFHVEAYRSGSGALRGDLQGDAGAALAKGES